MIIGLPGRAAMPRTLRAGDVGADVRALQDVLNFHIRRLAPLAVDGIFGPKTKARVIDFQRSNGLGDDGVAGPITNGKRFESEKQQRSLSILPAAAPASFGVRPPTLIPPLTLPGTGPSGVKLGLFAKGDFKGTVDYTSERATSTPLFQMQGAFTLGFDGRF
jgi:peptidoglycan hydrolase-like protein with peptidoglycan-binding domain